MKHLGDITKISGFEAPPVDIVCGGSPCQDLSVAGKRAGLKHAEKGDEETTRSGLFIEQIRIIKELRNDTNELSMRGSDEPVRRRPVRFMVWENVPGALSSGTPKGEDFRIVLEETAKVVDKDAVIPEPPNGKWMPSGCILGNGWSIAWRVHDAQFWGISISSPDGKVVKRGTPQRRKRIALVADFRGHAAPEILFERKSVSGDSEPCGEKGEGIAPDSERCPDPSSYTLKVRGGAEFDRYGKRAGKGALIQTELSGTLGVSQDQTLISLKDNPMPSDSGDNAQAVVYGISPFDSNAMKSANPKAGIYEAETSRTLDLNGGSPMCNQGGMAVVQEKSCMAVATKQIAQSASEELANPLCANDYKEPQVVCVEGNGTRESHQGDGYKESDTMYTLNTVEQHAVAYGVDCYNQALTGDQSKSLNSAATDSDHIPCVVEEPILIESNQEHATIQNDGISTTLPASMGMGGGYVPMVCQEDSPKTNCIGFNRERMGAVTMDDACPTIQAAVGESGNNQPMVCYGLDQQGGKGGANYAVDVAPTLASDSHGTPHGVCYGLDRASFNQGKNAKYDISIQKDIAQPIVARGPGGVMQMMITPNEESEKQ